MEQKTSASIPAGNARRMSKGGKQIAFGGQGIYDPELE